MGRLYILILTAKLIDGGFAFFILKKVGIKWRVKKLNL